MSDLMYPCWIPEPEFEIDGDRWFYVQEFVADDLCEDRGWGYAICRAIVERLNPGDVIDYWERHGGEDFDWLEWESDYY